MMHDNGLNLRPANLSDFSGITRLVELHAREGQILPRSEAAIRESIATWFVVEDGKSILACGSLLNYTAKLAEVRSLVVDDQVKRNGLGTSVVEALIDSAKDQGISTIFALTRIIPFFEKVGFTTVDKQWFPEKIWRDCVLCPIQNNCDEHAVALHLNNLPHSSSKSYQAE
jgi:amino-acid N-acetyltransferase